MISPANYQTIPQNNSVEFKGFRVLQHLQTRVWCGYQLRIHHPKRDCNRLQPLRSQMFGHLKCLAIINRFLRSLPTFLKDPPTSEVSNVHHQLFLHNFLKDFEVRDKFALHVSQQLSFPCIFSNIPNTSQSDCHLNKFASLTNNFANLRPRNLESRKIPTALSQLFYTHPSPWGHPPPPPATCVRWPGTGSLRWTWTATASQRPRTSRRTSRWGGVGCWGPWGVGGAGGAGGWGLVNYG